MTFNLCTPSPTGWSERDYDGYDGSGTADGNSLHGFHDLDPDNCRLKFYWPRNDTGGPTYGRIDFSRGQLSDPAMTLEWQAAMTRGDFSWGIGRIGVGAAGAGDNPLSTPRIELQMTGDSDFLGGTVNRGYRAVFVNTAGTSHETAWQAVRIDNANSSERYTTRVYIDGSTGHLEASDTSGLADVSASVALSGSFAGNYDRWESHYAGGGGAGSNQGGISEGNQYCTGFIFAVDVGARRRRPVVGRIGFG